MTITLELPEDVAEHLTQQGADVPRAALEGLAVEAYRAGQLTMEQVRRVLGYETRMQVDQFLQRHDVAEYTLADLQSDREALRRLDSASQGTSGT